ANPNKNAWFYLVLFVRFGTYQWVRFQIKIFFSPLRLVAKPRLARRAFGSDHRRNVGRLLILTRGESKNCVPIRLPLLPPLRLDFARSRRHRSKQQLAHESLVDELSLTAFATARHPATPTRALFGLAKPMISIDLNGASKTRDRLVVAAEIELRDAGGGKTAQAVPALSSPLFVVGGEDRGEPAGG